MVVRPFLNKLHQTAYINRTLGDPSGWPTPRWSQHASEVIMNRMGIQTAILSITAPGACILSDGQAQAALARQLNEYAATLCHRNPSRFRFFASLPDIRDLSAAISEIQYAMDSLHADGVILFTRYGPANTYLGHPEIEPVWQELNKRKAVVFIHPTHPVDTNKVNPKMSQPMIDYPHETTRTAVDMITSQTLQKFPDVKVILSHAGGSLPYLISRVATPLKTAPEFAAQWKTGTTHRDVMRSFRSFYYDTALSSSTEVLNMLLRTVPHDHILFGVSTKSLKGGTPLTRVVE